jgi:plastocyanin
MSLPYLIRVVLGAWCALILIGWVSMVFGAAVAGRVVIAGAIAPGKPLPVFKNRNFCGRQVANETLIVGRDGGVKNAVVILRALARKDRVMRGLPIPSVLDNQRCAFAPHVQVVTVGSEILLKNSDPMLHTVHARLGGETLFNVGLPKWRQVIKRLDRAGVVRIDCDVLHTWMTAAIVVSDSPYFAVSDETGAFNVDGLPLGEYELEVWHERLGARRQRVRVTENGLISVEIIYSAEINR